MKTIIDVRTPGEFATGHANGSINIPLQELPQRLSEIKDIKGDIVLCCASGMRSSSALDMLRLAGVKNVVNAGSWLNVR